MNPKNAIWEFLTKREIEGRIGEREREREDHTYLDQPGADFHGGRSRGRRQLCSTGSAHAGVARPVCGLAMLKEA